MSKVKDISGSRYGMLVVKVFHGKDKSGTALWVCVCDCGTEKVIRGNALKSGRSKSCGCMIGAKHGHRRTSKTSPEYATWVSMMSRCNNINDPYFYLYGGAGIKVCEKWGAFESFYKDMGERPAGKTIDRIDAGKGYFKENCRWATAREQARNRRTNVILKTPSGEMCISAAAEKYGLCVTTLKNRLLRGWSVEKAVMTPARPYGTG